MQRSQHHHFLSLAMALIIVSSAAIAFSKGSGYLTGAFHTEILARLNPAEVFYAGSLKRPELPAARQ
ncbi:hypothetical protein [Rhizobium sp. 007]|nr:hypothetical protein [Rhizobium sp. 007]QPB21584.1 hypothetical protein ISN39_09180 [Rhizobium sp. 007]